MTAPNPLILAAENSPKLLPLLRSNPSLASTQDAHGYSLIHAAASYNHLDLLRALVNEFHVNVNIEDEDAETALFVLETVEAAQVLIEELGADPTIKSQDGMSEGMTAEEKIRAEGDFTAVADFLKDLRLRGAAAGEDSPATVIGDHPPPLPPNVRLHMRTLEDEENLGDAAEADPGFRRRIEELAARDDFREEEGQKQLRELIADAIQGARREDRDVRRRVD